MVGEPLQPGNLEQLAINQLDKLMHVQGTRLGLMMWPDSSTDDPYVFARKYNSSLRLEIKDDERLYHRVPALIDTRNFGRQRTFFFDVPTYETLCEELIVNYAVTHEEVANLYIGVSLAANLLEERFSPHRLGQIDQFWSHVRDSSRLERAVRLTSSLEEVEQESLLESLMFLTDDNAVARINLLRFGLGMLFMECDEGPLPMDIEQTSESRLTQQFRYGLQAQLAGKAIYIANLMDNFGKERDYAQFKFSERLSELALAASFPMDWREVRTILQISR